MTVVFPSILAFIIIGILIFRLHLGNQAKKLSEDIALSANISNELEQAYRGKFINNSEKEKLLSPHRKDYQRATKLSPWLDRFHVKATDEIINLISSFESIDSTIKQHNNLVEDEILTKNKAFFDTCLKYPLDQQQRKAIIADENNVLVVSSAGSGKTSSIVGKVKYLTEIKNVAPASILLISYTHKAATELTERTGAKGLQGYTFHKLALELIGKATGVKPSICDNTIVMYDKRYPSVFVNEFLHPEKVTAESYAAHRNANKRWTKAADQYLLNLHHQGKSIKYISSKMGRSQTSIIMRLGKLGVD